MKQQFESIAQWQKSTFGGDSTALTIVTRLQDEILELKKALLFKRDVPGEFADCFILLMGAAKEHGLSYEDVVAAIEEKMAINRNRKWEKQGSGSYHHV